jgi:protein tyrosine phosphatase
MMTIDQQNTEIPKEIERIQIDKHILKSSNNEELILFMSILPGRRIRHDIRNIQDDLSQIEVDTILTLNETKELSFMNMTNKNIYNMDTYGMHIKRANIEHILYPIRDRFIPKSISDYIQFISGIILNANYLNRNRILVHCMGGMGRTGMTIVCLELVYEYMMINTKKEEKKQRFIERFCHYPFLLTNSCRVCQAISNVRKTRPGTIHNPLQIMFAHEFYARLKSSSYMQQIKKILQLNENLLLTNQDEFPSRPNTTSNNQCSL